MLVLSRKIGEKINIGDDITITIVKVGPNNVRVGIDAPLHLGIVRSELISEDDDEGFQPILIAETA